MKKQKSKQNSKQKTKDNKSNFMQAWINALTVVILLGEIALIFVILKFNVLPAKFLIPALVGTAVVSLGMIAWLRKAKSKTSKVLALLLSIALILGVTQVARIQNLLGRIAGADSEIHTMQVIVMDDAPYEDIQEFKDLDTLFGANTAQDGKNIAKVKEEIAKEEGFDINVDDYTSYTRLADDLYNGSLEVIVISEAHKVLLEEHKPNFEEETRVIATYEFEEIVESTNYNADVTKDTFSIFVSGIDTFGPLSSVSRSDVNMIMTINPTTKQILLTSIPRDYHVTLHSFGAKDKLTHAGIYGVNESVKTLEDLLSSQASEKIDIDFFLRVNFTSVVDIVNALNGVNVNSKFNFSQQGHNFQQGDNFLTGDAALAFVRARKNLPQGDFSRIQNQQALITGVLNKAMSPAIITNYGSFLSSVGNGFELSMSDKDLNKVIKQQLDTMASWDIIQIQLGATGAHSTNTYSMPGWNLYVAEPQLDTVRKAAEMIIKMENGERVSQQDFQ